jgi:hypothetical protein
MVLRWASSKSAEISYGIEPSGHNWVVQVVARYDLRHAVRSIGERSLEALHPGLPDTVDIAMVEVEDRVVRRGAGPHVATDPNVHQVVQHRPVDPTLDSVAKSAARIRVPGRLVVGALLLQAVCDSAFPRQLNPLACVAVY